MSTSKDMVPCFVGAHQPHHGLSLKDSGERTIHQPVRFTSKAILAELPAMPAEGITKTPPEAVASNSSDLGVETPPPSCPDIFDSGSPATAKGQTACAKALEGVGGSGSKKGQLPLAVTPVRTLKRKISSISPSGIATNKGVAEHDPANHEIKRLREEKGLKWEQIAEVLNKRLIEQGKSPAFTHNGVYSRYTRNAPRIAALEAWPSGQDEMLIRAYHEVRAEMAEELWHRVSDKIVQAGGERTSPGACAVRYNSL
ncbi:hypothetical protein FGG08_006430 [Glutinoglossum americanum]|uniref:Uncharacterized protein n=1 Tax=Glutinoglossum americanum TaxID=1670608 RepID=A0A9P8I3H3_9PEZI|nr:hypothetical protein FGG08_006430 [Glutinoglossum americanum]